MTGSGGLKIRNNRARPGYSVNCFPLFQISPTATAAAANMVNGRRPPPREPELNLPLYHPPPHLQPTPAPTHHRLEVLTQALQLLVNTNPLRLLASLAFLLILATVVMMGLSLAFLLRNVDFQDHLLQWVKSAAGSKNSTSLTLGRSLDQLNHTLSHFAEINIPLATSENGSLEAPSPTLLHDADQLVHQLASHDQSMEDVLLPVPNGTERTAATSFISQPGD